MSEHARYDLKKAYDKNLTGKERLHYLENYEHDVHRRGEAGNYTGNHPKYSRGVSMMGNPMNPIKAMDDDLKYMPIEDMAGQGTEGVNMKTNPINMKKSPVKMKKSPAKMGHKSPAKMGKTKSPVKALQFGRKN